MEKVKLISLVITALCITMAIINANMADAKFQQWRNDRKKRRAGQDIQSIIENARRRQK